DRVLDGEGFYKRHDFPGTRARNDRYEHESLLLAQRAVAALGPIHGITHLIIASCTGFTAPGLDFQLAQALGLAASVERTIVGFMGCFAAVTALRLARHIVRSEPASRVLVVNIELCGLHLQERWELQQIMMFLLFADGGAASLVSSEPQGIELGAFRATVIPDTAGLITWRIGDRGFEMGLSGKLPGVIRRWLMRDGAALLEADRKPSLWAVHAGGRAILDAVEAGLALPAEALNHSRLILRDFGNMSSATLMFVLQRILQSSLGPADGLAMAFGPGVSVETFSFRTAAP
ncbi:MAG: type III polyketide synthase, partial [Acetobacteraceae bacterium]|nr:type III polyketide synthase [Acetobacteraceae bacterium]